MDCLPLEACYWPVSDPATVILSQRLDCNAETTALFELSLAFLLAHLITDVCIMPQDLAKKKKIKTLGVSMGQGQEIIARKYMASATVEGQWVLLQNTHLGLGYLTEVLDCPKHLLHCFLGECPVEAMPHSPARHRNPQVCNAVLLCHWLSPCK